MGNAIDAGAIRPFRKALDDHPIYAAVNSVEDLRRFMEHHVYSVWDFMSLVKYVQGVVAPAGSPWLPNGDAVVRRFINELVLEEECDEGMPGDADAPFISHFELYCGAMREVGARTELVQAFVARLQYEDIDTVLAQAPIPAPARRFMRTTFDFIASDKPHVAAAALALGREHIIPDMFRALLARTGVTERQAPMFHHYLRRHIHLDEGFHAPLSLRLLNTLCGDDATKTAEALDAARRAVAARIAFWDEVLTAMSVRRTAVAG